MVVTTYLITQSLLIGHDVPPIADDLDDDSWLLRGHWLPDKSCTNNGNEGQIENTGNKIASVIENVFYLADVDMDVYQSYCVISVT